MESDLRSLNRFSTGLDREGKKSTGHQAEKRGYRFFRDKVLEAYGDLNSKNHVLPYINREVAYEL